MTAIPPGVDPVLYAANPLLDEMRRDRPALVSAAMAEGPNPPRLFGGSDLPPFTASGLDPRILATLPWALRRPAAAMPTLKEAYELVERYGDPDSAGMASVDLAQAPANRGYVEAFSLWLKGQGGGPADRGPQDQLRHPATGQYTASAAGDYATEAMHRELFGDTTGTGSAG
jgi:hypothetical protein